MALYKSKLTIQYLKNRIEEARIIRKNKACKTYTIKQKQIDFQNYFLSVEDQLAI